MKYHLLLKGKHKLYSTPLSLSTRPGWDSSIPAAPLTHLYIADYLGFYRRYSAYQDYLGLYRGYSFYPAARPRPVDLGRPAIMDQSAQLDDWQHIEQDQVPGLGALNFAER